MAILFIQHDRFFAARLFTALQSAIKSLEKYHQALALDLPCSNVRRLPFITEEDQIKPSSHYWSRLAPENKYRLLYQAALDDVPDSPIIVKSVQRYNVDPHRLLAAQGLAPKLYYSSTDDNVRYGKRFNIVMDYIDLRRPNILVGNDTAMLVDFDWCAKVATLLKSIVIQVWAGPRCGTRLPYCLVNQNLH